MKYKKDALAFLDSIEGTVGLFFNNDADGTTAGAIMIKFLKTKNIKPELFAGGYGDDIQEFYQKDFDNYIIQDMNVEETGIKEFESKGNFLIIDHHPSKDLSSDHMIHINPRFDDPNLYQSASQTTFLLLKEILPETEWIGNIGGVGDRAMEGTADEQTGAGIIDAVEAIKKRKGLISIARFLARCKKIEEFLWEEKYIAIKNIFDSDVEKNLALFDLSAVGNINFFQMKGKYSISSVLSSRLLDLYPKRTIFLYRQVKDGWRISGRSYTHDLNELFRKVTKGIGGGGGHPVAAGAHVDNIEIFKERVMQELKKKK